MERAHRVFWAGFLLWTGVCCAWRGGGGRTVLMGAAGPARWGAAHLFGGAWDCGMMLPGPAPAFHTPAPGGLSLAR